MSDPNQIDIKVRILWDLDKSGAQNVKTKVVELATITSLGDMNLKRANRIAQAAQGEIPGLDPTICNPACAIDQECVNNVCITPGACNPACGTGQVCSGGVCIDSCQPACKSTQSCQQGTCYDRCIDSTECTGRNICTNGLCQPGGTCSGNTDCPYNQVCNRAKKQCEVVYCSPTCGVNQACIQGQCQTVSCCSRASCNYPQFPCLSGYECKSGTCSKIVNTDCKYVDNNTQYVGSCPRTYYCPAPGQGGCISCNGMKVNRPVGCNCTSSGQCASGTCDPKTKICI